MDWFHVFKFLVLICNIYKQHMNLFFTCPVTGILQNVFLQNMLYINLNTNSCNVFTNMLQLLTHMTFSDDFLSRSLHETWLSYQYVRLIEPALAKPPCLRSLPKQNALLWDLYFKACSATSLVFDHRHRTMLFYVYVFDRASVLVGFRTVKLLPNGVGGLAPHVTNVLLHSRHTKFGNCGKVLFTNLSFVQSKSLEWLSRTSLKMHTF